MDHAVASCFFFARGASTLTDAIPKRTVTPTIRREIRRRAGIKPVTGRTREDGHLGRNFLGASRGDAVNAILGAAGRNLRLLRAWQIRLLAFPLSPVAISKHAPAQPSAQPAAR